MNPEQQKEASVKLRHEQANLYCTVATGLRCVRHIQVLEYLYLEMRQYLIKQPGMLYDIDLANLRAGVIGACSISAIAGITESVSLRVFKKPSSPPSYGPFKHRERI